MTEPLSSYVVRPHPLLHPSNSNHSSFAAPIAQDPVNGSITLAQTSDFQNELHVKTAASSSASTKFIASSKFISSTNATAFQKQISILGDIFGKLNEAGIFDLKAVVGAVKQVFNQEPSAVVKSPDFVALVEGLKDSIVAIKFVQVRSAWTASLRDF
jgi:hypothetical protein